MATFEYRVSGAAGKTSKGEVVANSRAEAYRILRARGLQPSEVVEMALPADKKKSPSLFAQLTKLGTTQRISHLSAKDLLFFTEELSDLLEAGLQLETALKIIGARGEDSAIKLVANRLRQSVRDGVSFSKALRECGNAFDPLYCNMVAAGETAGALPKILRSQCAHLTLITNLRARVTSALVYPSIVFIAAIVLMFVFLTVLVPQLTVLLEKSGSQLPFLTRILVAVSMFLKTWWWAVIAGIVASWLLAKAAISTPKGRAWWHRKILDLPIVGTVLRSKFYAELLQTLSTLTANGVTLLQGLHLLLGATGNIFLRGLLSQAAALVAEGASLSSALRRVGFFPPVLCDILAVGEQTGDIVKSLERAAVRFDKELTQRIAYLTTLIQPAIILIVAIFVGLIAYSMIAGILGSVTAISPGR